MGPAVQWCINTGTMVHQHGLRTNPRQRASPSPSPFSGAIGLCGCPPPSYQPVKPLKDSQGSGRHIHCRRLLFLGLIRRGLRPRPFLPIRHVLRHPSSCVPLAVTMLSAQRCQGRPPEAPEPRRLQARLHGIEPPAQVVEACAAVADEPGVAWEPEGSHGHGTYALECK